MQVYYDQMGRKIQLESTPQRIVSVVPSQTELLYDLGLETEVVGITKFCIHPRHWFQNKERVGGTKKLDIQKILSLNPDLVIANKEENEKEQIEMLAEKLPVWVSDINDLEGSLDMICRIGAITAREERAKQISSEIRQSFELLEANQAPVNTAYLIWKDPWMSVGADTFIHDMLARAGFRNIFADRKRYPVLETAELEAADLIMLSSEPYPFGEKHVKMLEEMLPGRKIELVDGEMFSWYGSRLRKSAAYFMELRKRIFPAAAL